MKRLAILGSTGSIGVCTVKLCEGYPDGLGQIALADGGNI
jgi:1-deoxy-D-xylulose 5-phosphate reductoisomerase